MKLCSLIFLGNFWSISASVEPLLDSFCGGILGCCVPYDTEDSPTDELCSSKQLA